MNRPGEQGLACAWPQLPSQRLRAPTPTLECSRALPCPCRSPGDPWPEEEPAELERRCRRRQAQQESAPALLSLSLGPFSLPLVPRPHSRARLNDEIAAVAELEVPAGLGAALPLHVCPAVAALQAALAERSPAAAQQLAAAGEPVDAAFYARWLKARGGCVELAAAGIAAHAAWRTAFLAQAVDAVPANQAGSSSSGSSEAATSTGVPEAAIVDELAAGKAFLQGLDSHGCPVIVVQAARWVLPAGAASALHCPRLVARQASALRASCHRTGHTEQGNCRPGA